MMKGPLKSDTIEFWNQKIILFDNKCVLVRLSGNYCIAKRKLFKILDPLLTYASACLVAFLMPLSIIANCTNIFLDIYKFAVARIKGHTF